jgi:hypothetical protein
MPHGGWWWGPADVDHDHIVMIVRDRAATIASAIAAGHARDELDAEQRREHALEALRALDPLLMSYEDLVRAPEDAVARLSITLGVELRLPEEIRKEAK